MHCWSRLATYWIGGRDSLRSVEDAVCGGGGEVCEGVASASGEGLSSEDRLSDMLAIPCPSRTSRDSVHTSRNAGAWRWRRERKRCREVCIATASSRTKWRHKDRRLSTGRLALQRGKWGWRVRLPSAGIPAGSVWQMWLYQFYC